MSLPLLHLPCILQRRFNELAEPTQVLRFQIALGNTKYGTTCTEKYSVIWFDTLKVISLGPTCVQYVGTRVNLHDVFDFCIVNDTPIQCIKTKDDSITFYRYSSAVRPAQKDEEYSPTANRFFAAKKFVLEKCEVDEQLLGDLAGVSLKTVTRMKLLTCTFENIERPIFTILKTFPGLKKLDCDGVKGNWLKDFRETQKKTLDTLRIFGKFDDVFCFTAEELYNMFQEQGKELRLTLTSNGTFETIAQLLEKVDPFIRPYFRRINRNVRKPQVLKIQLALTDDLCEKRYTPVVPRKMGRRSHRRRRRI